MRNVTEVMMGLFTRKPHVGGIIGYFGLADWWLDTFPEEERRALEALSAENPGLGGPSLLALTSGDFGHFSTSQHASQLVGGLAVMADKTAPELVPALLAKEEELAIASGNVLDLHFAYSTAIKLWYRRRESEPGAFEAAVSSCEKQIAIAPQALIAFKREDSPPVSHRGFQQLTIIREKQGDLDEALRLSREAKSQGWRDGKDDWSKRIAKLERRLAKH